MTASIPALDIQAIMDTLPHRYPFLLVDRVLEVVPGERLLAQKNVSINEPFFTGHFPNYSVMPGVLIIEALAQAAGILSFKTIQSQAQEGQIYFFAGIDNCRFKRPVVPGDVLMLEVSIERHARGIWKYKTKAMVDGQLAAEADLMCALREVPKSA
ncbi:FabA 3-hydroxymyristoyl/3-hydroxydecanoyl-(acyl carrier protein) dehydratases [Burkholderiales bacterium]|jgi:3-hydroxyacyl-[acyl-carrier-protein] dehydratase